MCPACFLPAAVLFAWGFVWPAAWGFECAAVGSVIENRQMPTANGDRHPLLANAAANVFIFFKPGQPHSRDVLKQVARIEKEMAGKSVHWICIASSRVPATNAVSEARAAGLAMPVLIDEDDALYGQLGVILQPVIGITDREHRLVACQPYARINCAEVIRARLRHLLGEITGEELAQVLQPPAATEHGAAFSARRRAHLAEKLFRAGNYAKALENIRISLAEDASAAPAHALHGQILLALGRPEEALKAFEKALKLDPASELAHKGRKDCEVKEKQL